MDFTETESESEDIDIQESESEQQDIDDDIELKMPKLKQNDRVMIRWYDSTEDKKEFDPWSWQSALVVSISPILQFALFQSEKEIDPPEKFIKGDMVTHIDLYGNKTWNPQKYYDFAANSETEPSKKDEAVNEMKSEI